LQQLALPMRKVSHQSSREITMDMGIRGRRALVNGASAGMGLAAAQFLAAEGVDMVLSARGTDRLMQAAQQISDSHGVPPPMTPDHRAINMAQWQASLDTGLMSPVQFIEAVLPGMFHTAAVHDQFTATAARNGTSYDAEVDQFVEVHQIPAKRFGDPREVGSLVAWLCSEFAGYITGQSIVVDGATTRSTF
jgi:NAD(P)-dependent dehydrogenase (short-subunit alcohol dehydrogenase family)